MSEEKKSAKKHCHVRSSCWQGPGKARGWSLANTNGRQHEAYPLKASQSHPVSDHEPLIYPQGIFAFSCANPPSAERMRWGYQVMHLDHQAQEKHLIELHSGP